ncbi:MAG: ATP-binding protein [Actinomycetota bacterium]|nr:ATP-binding protein [Actinomycetota bacterium]
MTFELELPRGLDSAAVARHALNGLEGRLPADQLGDVRLLVSELVTNAIRHAELGDQGAVRLVVTVADSTVRVEVRDDGRGFEVAEAPTDPERSPGWGLFLVETLADRWGVEQGDGALVWFELDRVEDGGPPAF